MKNIISRIYLIKTRRSILTAALLIMGIGISCKKSETSVLVETKSAPETSVTLTPEQAQSIGIETGHVEDRSLSGAVSVTGMLDVPPQNLVNITAPFGGFLRYTSLLQGVHVVKGQSIATVENPEYIQLQQDFLDTKAQVEYLTAEYQRQQDLAKENVNSQKILQKSEADLNSMNAKNNGLRAKLRMLSIDPEKLAPGVIRSTIELHSPIDGYVTQINSSIGSFVNPSDVMFRIVDTDHLHAELVAFERDITKIKIGQKIRFTLSNESTERTAKVFLIGREISTDRTVRIHGHLDQESRNMIPGMYLKAIIETGGQALPSLPEEAVVNYEGRNFIFIENGDGKNTYQLTEVITGLRENGFVEVTLPSSLSINTPVVFKGAYKLLSKMMNSETGNEPGH
jgi:membrane fusion protein, heavy metal efflux system